MSLNKVKTEGEIWKTSLVDIFKHSKFRRIDGARLLQHCNVMAGIENSNTAAIKLNNEELQPLEI